MNESTDFTASVAVVVDLIKSLRDKGINGPQLLIAINTKINDETLFSKAQRPNVLKAVNKALGTRYSISSIKRAVKEQTPKAIHVDELHGVANLNEEATMQEVNKTTLTLEELKTKVVGTLLYYGHEGEVTRGLIYEDFLSAHEELKPRVEELLVQFESNDAVLGGADDIIANLLADESLYPQFVQFVADWAPSAEVETPAPQEPVPEPVVEPLIGTGSIVKPERVRNIDRPFKKDEPAKPAAQPTPSVATTQSATQENTMTASNATAAAAPQPFTLADRVRAARANQAPQHTAAEQPKTLSPAEYEEILRQAGATTPEEVERLKARLFAAHPALEKDYLDSTVGLAAGGTQVRLGGWVTSSAANSLVFMQFVKKEIEQASEPEVETGVVAKVMTTLRGDRKEGFSSGVVAAAAAVVGGGIEMAVRGNLSVGSSVGIALGATASYFAANAVEDVMESETGRYLLSGSVGLVIGGLSSRAGSIVQSSMSRNEYAEDVAKALPEVHRPTGTLANPNVDMSKLFR